MNVIWRHLRITLKKSILCVHISMYYFERVNCNLVEATNQQNYSYCFFH